MLVAALAAGTIAQWLTVAAAAGIAWALFRGGGGTALATLEAANRILEGRVHELEKQGKRDAETIAELRGRTDVALAMQPLTVSMEHHEERAQARFEKTLDVLDLIATRLGKEHDGHG